MKTTGNPPHHMPGPMIQIASHREPRGLRSLPQLCRLGCCDPPWRQGVKKGKRRPPGEGGYTVNCLYPRIGPILLRSVSDETHHLAEEAGISSYSQIRLVLDYGMGRVGDSSKFDLEPILLGLAKRRGVQQFEHSQYLPCGCGADCSAACHMAQHRWRGAKPIQRSSSLE